MWLVSLAGKDVFNDIVHVCTISSIKCEQLIREYIKQKYSVEFDLNYRIGYCGYRAYDNITDDRDITLIIENIATEDDIIGL